ncbi:syndetin [Anabrus simplex]|uniref:syndetin n=1 Tax=Anabrus simplex TaxID=316456 RepID=UPI0035A2BDFE
MMDRLFRNFINKQAQSWKSPANSPSDETFEMNPDTSHFVVSEIRRHGSSKLDSESFGEEEVMNSIDSVYFNSDGLDMCELELKKRSEAFDCLSIKKDLDVLTLQHSVVSKQVLRLIEQKESACSKEFERFKEIHNELTYALRICREGRRDLSLAKRQFTTASLGILANYKRRQVIQGLLHNLGSIKALQQMEKHLQKLLNDGNYHGAIALLQECQQAASTYRHFSCVVALAGKLQDTMVLAEQQLDEALAKVCNHFDNADYSRVQEAYRLLGKTQPAMDHLLMHFTSAIHTAAFNVVYGHVELSRTGRQESNHKKHFQQLCSCIPAESLIPCLIDLCRVLWTIMRNYAQVSAWHSSSDSERPPADNLQETVDFEASCNKEYIKKKLMSGLDRIWQEVQMRVYTYLRESKPSWCKFDEFLQVLRVVHRLTEVGEEFCGSKSEELQKLMKEQSGQYFRNYHRERLEELRIFLENEGWEICPVKPNFSILQLQEFRSLRGVLKCVNVGSPECSSSNQSQDGSSTVGGFFTRYAESGSPFDMTLDDGQDEDILANIGDEPSGYFSDESDEDIPEELKRDFVEEVSGEALNNKHSKTSSKKEFSKAPVLTNTSLSVLRQCGKYLQLSRLLRPVTNDVLLCVSQLLDYYLYAVYVFFTADLMESCQWKCSQRLRDSLDRIHHSLILAEQSSSESDGEMVHKDREKIAEPCVSPVVDLTQQETLYGLAERVVGVESLVFLAKQFELLHSYMEQLAASTSQGSSPFLQQLYAQMVDVAVELRQPVYACVSSRAVDLSNILNHMKRVDWEVKNVMSQHSQYVDILLRELQIFAMRLDGVVSRIPIPREVYNILWEHVIQEICNAFIEGFSSAKKCSVGGRGLMLLDFTQFLSKLKKLTSLRPIPNAELVELYVKAYYMPVSALEVWIQAHNEEYTSEQLKSLVRCTCQNDSKTRQRLETLIKIKR